MRKAINGTLKILTISSVIVSMLLIFGGILYTVFDKGKIRFKIKNKYIGTMLRRL